MDDRIVASWLRDALQRVEARDSDGEPVNYASLRDVDAEVREVKVLFSQAEGIPDRLLDDLERDDDFRANSRWVRLTALSHYLESALRFLDVSIDSAQGSGADQRSVFVVHGRDEELRKSMFAFVRALGLAPMEWSEALRLTGKPSPYVGEVLDHAFGAAQAVVVLFSPDDEVRLSKLLWNKDEAAMEQEVRLQARPNVLFEAGMAFGRHPDRTVLVEVGDVKGFSDIGGRHVVRLDNSVGKRADVVDRLELAGCEVSRSGRDWYTTGDFQVERRPESLDGGGEGSAETEEKGSTLPEETETVLQAVAGARSCSAMELAEHLGIHEEKARYLLDELVDHELLEFESGLMGVPDLYSLSSKGRRRLVERGLL